MREAGRLVSDYVEAGAPGIIAVLGDYGIGKTFTLLNIEKNLRNHTFLRDGTAEVFPAYMKALPGSALSKYGLYIYRSIVEGLGLRTFTSLVDEVRSKSEQEDLGMARVLEEINQDLANPLVRLRSGLRDGAWAYLRGGSVSAPMLRKLDVSSRIDTDEKAQFMILEILKLLHMLDKQGVLLMIDEWEYVFTATGPKRGIQLHTAFKELYDRIQEAKVRGGRLAPIVFLFACTPAAWNENIPSLIREVGPGGVEPFWQRIARTYTLPPFEESETREIIANRIGARRTRKMSEQLYPFTDSAVTVIHENAQGVPRRILKRCAFLLEEAEIQERSNIDESFALDRLASYVFT